MNKKNLLLAGFAGLLVTGFTAFAGPDSWRQPQISAKSKASCCGAGQPCCVVAQSCCAKGSHHAVSKDAAAAPKAKAPHSCCGG